MHRYRRADDGRLVYETKSKFAGNMIAHLGLTIDEVLGNAWTQGEEREWEHNGFVYRVERLTVAQAIDERWRLLFRLMGNLAEDMGDDNVRLIAWFD